ncbi:dephospho-CoA kinase [Caldisalinibacter kiritimatiensis]|uniref:Dephospho-CoA kinase n=1 Tax=Caldisalinibacter kiritimatiensis TaxID=1304284 RepID=R1AT90_9FIRM|nr:dephospho-CoA kinase [Caldisalinibacter kiritimatiensis]EOC99851.1 Dephospho-CoA kinase [Caldisalinibacter kiritimatiensis]
MIQSKKQVRIIGITGGISTGKSTVSRILIKEGYPVIDADIIAREVVRVGKTAYREIVNSFGEKILNQDMTINRERLGEIVFNDKESRLLLNKIVHSKVVEEIKSQIEMHSKEYNIIFLDIPLLIEEMDKLKEFGLHIDEIWLVYTDEETQLERLMKRDNLDKESAFRRIRAQMPIEKKKKYADVVIDNTGGIEELKDKIDALIVGLK